MADDIPLFYDDLDEALKQAWNLMAQAAQDRKSPMHAPVVGSIDQNGNPSQRVMVLREAMQQQRMLRFHTDSRSTKCAEFGTNQKDAAPVSILAYHPEERAQLRLTGRAWVEADGKMADAAWQESTTFAKRCYLAQQAPGTKVDSAMSGLPTEIEGINPSVDQIVPARPNFAILLCEITGIDWLYLANAGHRRARFDWDAGSASWQCQWLIP